MKKLIFTISDDTHTIDDIIKALNHWKNEGATHVKGELQILLDKDYSLVEKAVTLTGNKFP